MKPKKDTIEKSILMVPLFIAFIWMGFLVFNVGEPVEGQQMSPSRLDAFVNALFIFIVIYAIVLVVIFVRMNKKVPEPVVRKTTVRATKKIAPKPKRTTSKKAKKKKSVTKKTAKKRTIKQAVKK